MDGRREHEPEPGEPVDEASGEAERNRRQLDDIPPPGTDPLHEGP